MAPTNILRCGVLALAVVFTAAGCTPRSAAVPPTARVAPSPDTANFSSPTASDCAKARPQAGLAEVKGQNLWALVFAPLPISAGKETKIVWRMGGRGIFTIAAKATDATMARLTFGPEQHGGSSWYIPNTDEWGTGWVFSKPGCWRVHASRGGATGDVYFLVVDASTAGATG